MDPQARVTSIEALEAFRARLILFLGKSRSRIDDVLDEAHRTRSWLQQDRLLRWEAEIRRRKRALDQAEQELLTAKLSAWRENIVREKMAVRRAQAALDEAAEKLRNVKRWIKNYESAMDPLLKKLGTLRGILDNDLPKAGAYLMQAQKTLETYAETRLSGAAGPQEPPQPPETGEEKP
jgi:chromosome segregation ATPase